MRADRAPYLGASSRISKHDALDADVLLNALLRLESSHPVVEWTDAQAHSLPRVDFYLLRTHGLSSRAELLLQPIGVRHIRERTDLHDPSARNHGALCIGARRGRR